MSLVRKSVEIMREEGIHEFVDRSLTYYRKKVPGPLSPLYPYILSYDNTAIENLADEVFTVQEPQSIAIKYTGELGEQVPPFVNNQDWLRENMGRKVYQFSNADIIGSSKGILTQNRYRPREEGPPSMIRVGNQFIAPASIGTKTQRKKESMKHLDRVLGTTGVIRHWPSGGKPDREFELAFLLPNPYGQAYASFQSDLFKLRAFERYKEISNEDPRLIIPAGPSELVRKYLTLMGYPPDSYVTLQHETIRARRLLVPSYRPRKGNGELQPSPSDRPWARDRILSNIEMQKNPSAERIYVSRQDERRRRVANIDEIRPILRKYDILEYNPGNHSLEDQIRTFSQANLFVGPHSSGMINSMFASKGAVIELLSREHWRTSTVFIVAKEMGFEYEICPCEPVRDSHNTTRHQDIVVNPSLFRETIERVSQSSECPSVTEET